MRYLTAWDKAYLLLKRQLEADNTDVEEFDIIFKESIDFLHEEGFLENGKLTQKGHIYACKVGALNPNYEHMPLKDIRKTIALGMKELENRGECL